MAAQYSVEVCRQLEERFRAAAVQRPLRVARYDAGTELSYQVRSVGTDETATVKLRVERFVGGGFAGQVYQVKVLAIDAGEIPGLKPDGIYAMKILIPPSGFSCLFRNLLYWIGFQGPFQLQVNPAAARAGALWQKFIRRAARLQFGDERSVVDIYGTFTDEPLGSCGELSEWIDGRTWRLEVDDRLDLLKRWRRGHNVDDERLGSPEYRAKRQFMGTFVYLLHEMGAHEFARQYEWSTCKSQPNCLKRKGLDDDPAAGLTAVDFRAGLALLPFLPMSPGDIKLIVKGIARGSLVQFDRGDLAKLERFVAAHPSEFADMRAALDELKEAERIYRNSVPDVTHNHVKLLYSRKLWSTIFDIAVTGWQVKSLVAKPCEEKLRRSRMRTFLFFLVGCIPLLGKVVRRAWGREDWRRHYARMLSSARYLRQAFWARTAEKMIGWYRSGRVNAERAQRLADQPWRFLGHWLLSILPAGLHRFLTDWPFAKEKLAYLFVRPVRLYFNAELREQWLRDMVAEGQRKHMLSDADANTILSQLGEPFIQKYLKSLAVHVCTLPVTQVVSVTIAVVYVLTHPDMPRAQAWGIGLGIIALFQVVPLSPGSLTRGLYVVYLVIRERNFKDYNIAVFLGFFKYVGYLAFPIQMTYRYPALARFMAVHWATEAVHVVPVFGERGALLEHWVFSLFYNWPLTIRRRMRRRAQIRAAVPARYWHVPVCALVATGIFGLADCLYFARTDSLPALRQFWWLVLTVPLLEGVLVTLAAGGAALGRRIVAAAVAGALAATLATGLSALIASTGQAADVHLLALGVWRVFIFTILSVVGAIGTELTLPEPEHA
ncbi:MAG: hypothetical protein JW993_17790 [Sedimentisphaerales bacterium]|nr:hypothetical protein [Sedimentisphaerales bacterium]